MHNLFGVSANQTQYGGNLSAVIIRGDGSHRDCGTLSGTTSLVGHSIHWWKRLWGKLRACGLIPLTMGFAAFCALYANGDILSSLPLLGLVTTAGVNFAAVDQASGQASPRISSMNFHDSGTGTNAAVIGDTIMQTQAGPATRATGTQSNPSSGQYRSVGTITYAGTLAITEWGVFNQAAQGGTLWDRRTFAALNVINTDQIAWQYTLSWTAGGS